MKDAPGKSGRSKRTPRKRAYDPSGRRAEAERTAARIVAAATELVKEGVLPEALSYADVGARAGVSGRTVYRHFPETSDLLHAIALATMSRINEGPPAIDRPLVADQLARFHKALCADPSLFHVFIVTPLRSGMDYENYMRAIFADVLQRIPAQHRDAATATFEILANPYAWLVMHTFWHLPQEQITRACLAAVQAVADRFQREPELLDPSAPLPPLFREPRPNSAPRRQRKERNDER